MNLSHLLILFLTVSLFLPNALPGQSHISATEVERKVDSIFLDNRGPSIPGTAVLIVKDKETILNKGFGFANLEHAIPITPNTVFDLASLSKQFTGYAIALLIEQGKLSENDAIGKYMPELPSFAQEITIRHLLHHTGGLRDWTSTLPLSGRSFDDVISFDHILRMVYEQESLNFTPGDQYSYSNTGYNLLAEIIQRVTGESFRTWTDTHIFQPLDMPNTFFLDNHRESIPNRATGYYESDKDLYYQVPNNLTALGSSSLFSTTSDLAQWVSHLLHPSEQFQPAVQRMLQTDTLNDGSKNTYAYGIDIDTYRGTEWISHSGSWAAFRTYIAILPAYDLSIVVLNNHARSASNIARQIASFYVPDSKNETEENLVEEDKQVRVTQDVLHTYTGTYKLGSSWYVHISQKGNELWTRATAEDIFPMIAIADTVFLIKAYGNRTMTFHQDQQGKVRHLVYNDMICPKMSEDTTFSLTNALEYTGAYYSSELNTLYKVELKEDELKLWSIHNGDIKLIPAWTDEFLGTQWYARIVAFKRDENGKISGLSISQSRAKHQFFEKVSEDFYKVNR